MDRFENSEVEKKFNSFRPDIRDKLLFLRQLILHTADEIDAVSPVVETLKWGEPGYVTKTGSTIRLGIPKSASDQYAMYFHCKTRLVETFKELYNQRLNFEGNRAIIFNVSDPLPVNELKHCISLALTYHKIKHLPLLGA